MLKEKIHSPPGFHKWLVLLDGTKRILIRPIRYTDKNAILALFDRLSEETRFLRFHYFKARLTDDDLNAYCAVDYHNEYALVAEMFRKDHLEIVGVGRYNRLNNPAIAEVAFVVEDKEQGNGIGTHLLNELAVIAISNAIETFVAEMMNDNIVMLDIFRKHDPDINQHMEGSSIKATFCP